jgi:hypothetical protein
MLTVTILEQDYQRNGVSGKGFYSFRIRTVEDGETRTLLATIEGTEDDELDARTCRVVDPLDLSAHWRGDSIGDALMDACRDGRYDPHARVTHLNDRYVKAAHAAGVHARGNLWCPDCNAKGKGKVIALRTTEGR